MYKEGGKEGGNTCRCHFLPWSLPRRLIWSEQICVQAQEEPAARVSCWFQAARPEARSRPAPCQRASESRGLEEVGGWDCVPVARGFPGIFFLFERQTLERSRSWCKHTVSVAVAAVRAGAEDDSLRGKSSLAFSLVSFPTLLLFLGLSSWTFVTVSAERDLHKCPNKDRSTMITSFSCFQTFIYVFSYCAILGIKYKALVVLLLLLLFLDLPSFCWVLPLLVASQQRCNIWISHPWWSFITLTQVLRGKLCTSSNVCIITFFLIIFPHTSCY